MGNGKWKILHTFNLYFSFLTNGMCVAILGPTLIDLTHMLCTDMKTISYIFTFRSAGCLLGSFIGGILFDMVRKEQAVLSISSFISSMSVIAIVWIRRIEYIFLCLTINAFLVGVLITGANVCCLNLWGKDNGPFYQALHFFFSVGGLMASLVAAPFLGNYSAPFQLDNQSVIFSNQTIIDLTINTFQNESFIIPSTTYNVTHVYLCLGILCLLSAILFSVTWFNSLFVYKEKVTDTSETNKTSFIFTCFLVFCVCLLVFSSMGIESGYAQMLVTYVTQMPIPLSTMTGSYMTAAYWASFCVSRFAAIVIIIKLSPRTMIFIDVLLMMVGILTLLFLSVYYEWALWLTSILLGVGVASVFPASVTWIEKYIIITNKIAAFFSIACVAGEMMIPNIIGHFITEKPEVLIYVIVVAWLIIIVVTLALFLVLRKIPDKYTQQSKVSKSAIDRNEQFDNMLSTSTL